MALHLEGKRILMSLRDKGKKKEKEQEAKLFFPDGKLFCLFRSLPYQQTHVKVPLILILSQD